MKAKIEEPIDRAWFFLTLSSCTMGSALSQQPAIVECASLHSTYVYLGHTRPRRTRFFGPALCWLSLVVNDDAESFLCLSFVFSCLFCLIRVFCFVFGLVCCISCFLFLVCIVYILFSFSCLLYCVFFFLLLFSIACCLLSMCCYRFRIIFLGESGKSLLDVIVTPKHPCIDHTGSYIWLSRIKASAGSQDRNTQGHTIHSKLEFLFSFFCSSRFTVISSRKQKNFTFILKRIRRTVCHTSVDSHYVSAEVCPPSFSSPHQSSS